jgi:hypothetical protein
MGATMATSTPQLPQARIVGIEQNRSTLAADGDIVLVGDIGTPQLRGRSQSLGQVIIDLRYWMPWNSGPARGTCFATPRNPAQPWLQHVDRLAQYLSYQAIDPMTLYEQL